MRVHAKRQLHGTGRLRRQAIRLLTVVMSGLVATGCTTGDGDPAAQASEDAVSFADRIQGAIESARDGGAGDTQMSILKQAQEDGVVTFEQAHSAILANIDCYVEGGGTARYYERVEPSGLVVPGFLALAEDDEALTRFEPLMEACSTQESFWVNNVYQLQPGSQETRDAYLEAQAPVIRKCLEDNGYAVDPEATPEELVSQAMQTAGETSNTVNCYN